VREVLIELAVGDFVLEINNRKPLRGFSEGLGIDDPLAVIRVVDKLRRSASTGSRGR